MPFFATLELLLTPERLINTDLTKKGIYKLQIGFPNDAMQRKQKYRIGKVGLVPSSVYLRQDDEDRSHPVFLPTDRSLQLRLERHSTQLIYPSNAKIETIRHDTIGSSGPNAPQLALPPGPAPSRRRSSLFGGLVGSGASGGAFMGSGPNSARASNSSASSSSGKQFKYSSRHFHILYKEQEITFLDNILVTIEWMDILHWMQKEEDLDLKVELCMFREPSEEELRKFCDDIDQEWDPEIAFQRYTLTHHNDEAYWDSIMSNTLRIHCIWEGINAVHPVSFTDGWNFCMMWMGVHSCVTRLQYYVGKEDWAVGGVRPSNMANKKRAPPSPSVSFMKPPLPSPTLPRRQSSSSQPRSPSPSPRISRRIPKSSSTSSFTSLVSASNSIPSQSSSNSSSSSSSSARRRSSISRKLFSYVNTSSSARSTEVPPKITTTSSLIEGAHPSSPMDEYISQRHQRLFETEFIPYVNQNLRPLWPRIGSMTFYNPITETLTICSNFARLIARNWQYMDERLGQILINNGQKSSPQHLKLTIKSPKASPQSTRSPQKMGTPTASPMRNRRSMTSFSVHSPVTSRVSPTISSPSGRRRSSNPAPISPSSLSNSTSPVIDHASTFINLNENSALWIPKMYRMLGEKWVQQLHELFKRKSDHPWLLPYILNDVFRMPFELDMTIRWKEALQRCSLDLGSVHTELRAQHRRNLQREWYLFVHQPEMLEQKNAHNDPVVSQVRVTDNMFPSMRNHREKHLSQFSIEYLRNPSRKAPPPPLMQLVNGNFDVPQPPPSVPECSSHSGIDFDPLSPNCKHLIVFVPGFKGSPFDFRLLRFLLELHLYPSRCKYFFFEPKSELYHTFSIRDMATTFAEALTNHIKERKLEFEKISFFAHSLGGLIVRSALQPGTQAFQIFNAVVPPEKYFTFCTFGSPHLGSFSLKSTLVSTAIYVMSTVQNIKCLQMLSFSDESEVSESWLYKLNSPEVMRQNYSKYFKHVILCGSKQDTFVNFTSSTIFYDESSVQSNMGVGSDVVQSWVREFDESLSKAQVLKVNVKFASSVRGGQTFEKFTGKFYHVAYMQDEAFLNALISLHIRDIFTR